MSPEKTVIVIRSLVPGGVAEQDGRLKPVDRLMSVNDTNLENASLSYAVETLKGAPQGIVLIGLSASRYRTRLCCVSVVFCYAPG